MSDTNRPTEKRFVIPTIGESITSSITQNTYTIGEKIGEGSFGLVYNCRDIWNNELAVKILKPLGTYEKIKNSAISEIFKLLALRNPYLTFMYDAFEYRDTFYIITEKCYGPISILFKLKNFNGLVWIMAIARCILQAIQYLHINNYVHQDIHQGNVFISFTKDEMLPKNPGTVQFKLGDLGVTKPVNEVSTRNTRAQWMLPPEIINTNEFGPIDNRIDIYHIGLLFLQIAYSKELKFTHDDIINGKPRELALQLPTPYSFALEKTLRRHVEKRTATALELWRDLHTKSTKA